MDGRCLIAALALIPMMTWAEPFTGSIYLNFTEGGVWTDGDPITDHKGYEWCLFKFVDGEQKRVAEGFHKTDNPAPEKDSSVRFRIDLQGADLDVTDLVHAAVQSCAGEDACSGFVFGPPVLLSNQSDVRLTLPTGPRDVEGSVGLALVDFSPIRVNAGGPAYTDPQGHVWAADHGFNTGEVGATSSPIINTDKVLLYQTERWDKPDSPELRYEFPVPPGEYMVRLHFAEFYSRVFNPGGRLFNVRIEDEGRLTDFDVYQEAGSFRALVKHLSTTVEDGTLTIDFEHVAENPKVAAIEILPN